MITKNINFSNIIGEIESTLTGIIVGALPVLAEQLTSGQVTWKSIGAALVISAYGAFGKFKTSQSSTTTTTTTIK